MTSVSAVHAAVDHSVDAAWLSIIVLDDEPPMAKVNRSGGCMSYVENTAY
jgi:hypothetical protein